MSAEATLTVPYPGFPEIADPQPSASEGNDTMLEAGLGNEETTSEEIAPFAARAVQGVSFNDALETATSWSGGAGLFYGVKDKVAGALCAAYPVALHLISGGKEAMQEALSRSDLPAFKRFPKKGTEALNAVYLVAKPQDEAQRKACSAYSKALNWAAEEEIEPAEFVERFSETNLDQCTAFVRDLRKRKKAEASSRGEAELAQIHSEPGASDTRDPDPQKDKPKLIIALQDGTGADQSLPVIVSTEHYAALQLAFAKTPEFENVFHVLGALRDAIQKADRQHSPTADPEPS